MEKTRLVNNLFVKNQLLKRTFSCSSSQLDAKTFRAKDIEYDLKPSKPDLPDDPTKLIFGHKFTDHMFTAEWDSKNGWQKPKIGPFHNLSIHPAAKVLHYSMELFEGMKAYHGTDNNARLFRPDLNALRMQKSSVRSALPSFDREEFIACLKKFVSIEKNWIPKSNAASLYLRPTLIGTEPALGVSSSNKALFFIIASPIGPYFPTGFKPVTLLADSKYIRAFPGGVGNCKVGSNYGPTIYVNLEAQKLGCQQVLWLFGKEENLTEAGTMNIFIVIENDKKEVELITPPLDGTILEGVTRQSILDMTRTWKNLKVSERTVSMKEVLELNKNNKLLEMFGAGTACVVCPIDGILYKGQKLAVPTMTKGAKIMNRIAKDLNDIHYGRTESKWSVTVE